MNDREMALLNDALRALHAVAADCSFNQLTPLTISKVNQVIDRKTTMTMENLMEFVAKLSSTDQQCDGSGYTIGGQRVYECSGCNNCKGDAHDDNTQR